MAAIGTTTPDLATFTIQPFTSFTDFPDDPTTTSASIFTTRTSSFRDDSTLSGPPQVPSSIWNAPPLATSYEPSWRHTLSSRPTNSGGAGMPGTEALRTFATIPTKTTTTTTTTVAGTEPAPGETQGLSASSHPAAEFPAAYAAGAGCASVVVTLALFAYLEWEKRKNRKVWFY